MKDNMRKIADTIIKFVRNRGSDMTERDESLKAYHAIREERKQRIGDTRDEIQTRIERVCRQQNTLIIDDLGFESISALLFEDSWQESVTHLLQNDGYRCMMSFNYDNGKPRSCLTVSWGE